MTDALIFVGKGQKALGLVATVTGLERSLRAQGYSVAVKHQTGPIDAVPQQVAQALAETGARALFTVGYSVSTKVATGAVPQQLGQLVVAVLPDIPGDGDTVYSSALKNLELTVQRCDFVLVADEPSRSLVEYRVAGAAGNTGLVGDTRSLVNLLKTRAQRPQRPLKVLVSSHDFRFIGDVVRMLQGTPGVQVRLQQWELDAATPADLTAVRTDMEWADTVLCEWTGRQAVWYSQNLVAGKRLVVRLHGFESSAAWISGLDFNRVDRLIAVSDFYSRHLVSEHGWDEQRVTVIGNSLSLNAFDRPKRSDARFHLGMLGFTPLLKRPHLAVDILRQLLEHDDRFVLYLRGKTPWSFPWVWNNRAHEADAYRTLFETVGADPLLRQHVVFEQPGANVESWFTKIGWVLSLSERETFHLAAAEGMASGAVPVFLRRRGVTSIFSDRWVFDTPESIARYIAMTAHHESWDYESQVARQYAARFDFTAVAGTWLQVLTGEGSQHV